MDEQSIQHLLSEYAEKYEPLITFDEAAAIVKRSKDTIYQWSSEGRFQDFICGRPRGPKLLSRDAFIRHIVSANVQ